MNFEFKREIETVTAYGKEYPIPTMTIGVLSRINETVGRINGSLDNTEENTKAMLDGIAVFIGEDETKRIFPSFDTVDVNEVFAFWSTLKKVCEDNTRAVIEKYGPNTEVKKPNA